MNQHITVQPLVYNGEVITQRDEMISLTDMWRAAGAPENKRPAEWARKEGESFIAFIADTQNMAVGHILKSKRGIGGGTFGNWQVALAYAKYLSPEFHAWCNTVVRERMEGKSVSTTSLPPDVAEYIRRTDGISRMLAHKVTGLESAIALIAGLVQPHQPVIIRRGKTAGQIWRDLKLPKIKGVCTWFGNRLGQMGCQIEGRGELGTTTARLFDPDKAATWLANGGMHVVKQKITERQGQGALRLVGEAGNVTRL